MRGTIAAAWAVMATTAFAALAAALLVLAPRPARAALVMVTDDFAPMRMVPSGNAPRKAYAPLGLLLETRRGSNDGQWIEATNGERWPFEEPGNLHYWLRPASVLGDPGATKVTLDLVLREAGRGGRGRPGARIPTARFLADSTALPDSYYVAANAAEHAGPWGEDALIPAPAPAGAPGSQDSSSGTRGALLRGTDRYTIYVGLSAAKPIRAVHERLAVARILVREPRCDQIEYVETEVLDLINRTRRIGAASATSRDEIPTLELTTTESSVAQVLHARLVYIAEIDFEDGSHETAARRLLVHWLPCP